jgi:hypothetical protein
MRGCRMAVFLVATVLLLTGCSDFVDRDQLHTEPEVTVKLEYGHPVGQTFVAHHAGLDGVEVWLDPGEDSQGEIQLHLRSDPQAENDLLVTAKLPLAQVMAPGFYRFSFPPLRDSHSRYFYVFLEMKRTGVVQVGAGPGDAYLDGALYRDHQPLDAQMSFRLIYDPRWMLLDLGLATMRGLGLLAVAGLLYVVPGWALLVLFQSRHDYIPLRHWAETLGVVAGLSLAVYPLLLLWTNVVGLQMGPMYAWLPVSVGLMVLLWRYRPWQLRWERILALPNRWLYSTHFWPDVALVVIIALAATGRLLAVRGLDMPLWADSIQHTTIVKRILESGGLFQSWEPYTPYRSFSAHFGFHANVAAWAWFTRSDAPQAMIWGGQVLNLLAVLTLYPLAYRIKGVWGGVITVLVAGLLTQFPAYYTNWGRYPQMIGQVALPVAAWWLWMTFQEDKVRKYIPWMLGSACLVVGMILMYYRMAFHYFAFVLAAFLILFKLPKQFLKRRLWLSLISMAIVSGILVFPWIQNISTLHQLALTPGAYSSQEEVLGFWQQVEGMRIGWFVPKAIVVFLGTLVGVWAGGTAALPVVWLWMLVGLPILRLTNLPGVYIIQEFTVQTSLYIPQALIWGTLGGHLADKVFIQNRWRLALLASIIIGIGVWKLPSLLAVIDRDFDLSTRPDVQAAEWIRDSLPADAFFLINGIVYTDGFSAIAGDAGCWLPILAQRGVVIPPQYALLTEQPNEPGYGEAVNHMVQQLFETSPITPEGHEIICDFPHPITYVYLGQRRGMVIKALPIPPPHSMLSAELLVQDPAFRLVYHRDRVMIFEFDRAVCR